ncbi:MAG: hypothetical protein DHS20C18_23550 [Saprospiraceae bacterium]|nr:MAG: hypothetical protein DHS20C18_23550 [Saprospiraceae bacterium]
MLATVVGAQTDSVTIQYQFKGQASAYMLFNPDNTLELYGGARYIPEFSLETKFPKKQLLDLEASVNISGTLGMHAFDTTATDGDIRPYRAWLRYTRPQLELRVGLQKINFGSASILRPLMWFDQIDPRDPLQLTDGVWGALGRYYFLNNANIWVWSLYGNKNRRGFDSVPSNKKSLEFGGRFQFPTKKGEAAVTYHYREAAVAELGIFDFENTPEHRIGIDGKWDLEVGLWLEATWIHKTRNIGILTNQNLINIGTDYTFGIGNGLNVIAEQLLISVDEKAFAFKNTSTLTALSVSYPLGLFDDLSAIIYFDWTNEKLYNILQWKHSFSRWTLNVLAFWNPKNSQLPQQQFTENLFGGKGIQILGVYNH